MYIFHIGILSCDTCKMVPEIQLSSNHNCWKEIMGKTWNNNLDRQIIRSPMGKSSRRRCSFGIGKMIGRRSGAFDIGKMMGKVGKKVLAPIRELHRGGSYGGYLNSPTAKKRRSGNYMAELVEFKDKRGNFSVTFQAQEMSEDISQGELYCIK